MSIPLNHSVCWPSCWNTNEDPNLCRGLVFYLFRTRTVQLVFDDLGAAFARKIHPRTIDILWLKSNYA